MKKLFIPLIILSVFIFMLIALPKPASSQAVSCQSSSTKPWVTNGLVTAPTPTAGSFYIDPATGKCIADPKAAFAPFKIPSYSDLKSLYYQQSKNSKSTLVALPASFSSDRAYLVSGDLEVNRTPAGNGTQVIFVEGNLNFNADYTYGTPLTGTVFIVKGDVTINSTVTRIDAVIISQGIIYTAGANCSADLPVQTDQLLIRGSLISINQIDPIPIKFCRSLDPLAAINNQNSPAEKINNQVKYLVILRNILSETLQKWSEVTADTDIIKGGLIAPR